MLIDIKVVPAQISIYMERLVIRMNYSLRDADKITMTHTGLIPAKSGKVVHVCFERKTGQDTDYAEIILPGMKILNSKGFDDGELAVLQLFLKEQERDIVKKAKQINHDIIFNL